MRDVRCPYCGGDNVVEVYEDERWYCLDCERYFDIDDIIEMMEGESRNEL
jgi:transcription initiation factor TFIIIB Brf1 subunit/transcription initiation factor TFIIB